MSACPRRPGALATGEGTRAARARRSGDRNSVRRCRHNRFTAGSRSSIIAPRLDRHEGSTLRARSFAVVATAAIVGVFMGIAPLTAAAKTKQTNIACTAYLTEVHGNVLKGADKGPISCASPLGDGTQSDTFTMKFNKKKTGGTGLVKFKDTFKG